MRLIVPLQGVVQGRGGIVLGSLIPCALFYCLQFYLKRHRSSPPSSPPALSTELPRSSSQPLSPSADGSTEPVPFAARALPIAKPSDSPYYVGLERVSEDPYDAMGNPEGVIQLGLAENRLSLDLIEKGVLESWNGSIFRGKDDSGLGCIATYQPLDGLMGLKMAVAGFMSQVMGKTVSFDPSRLVLTSGATPAVELLCFCLADLGNALLIPTPYYPGFDRDIKWRTGLVLVPVHCHASNNFSLSIAAVDQAFNRAQKQGLKVRGILICSPSNPVGNLLSRDMLCDLLGFSREKNIHIISDEVFAGSTFGDEEFVSMAEIVEPEEDSDKRRVHVVYGLSKDLSLPGFRIGALYSFNDQVLDAAKKLSRFCSVSAPTQRLVTSMLSNERFVEHYIATNRERIRRMYDMFVSGLREVGIGVARSSGGLFCWADMRGLMRSCGEGGEHELWEKLLNVGKVNVTPGLACHCVEPGWFRCCFSTLTEEDVPVVVGRIRRVTETLRYSG